MRPRLQWRSREGESRQSQCGVNSPIGEEGLQAPEESLCGDKAFHVFAFELGIGVDSAAACELAQLLVIDEDGLVGLDVD